MKYFAHIIKGHKHYLSTVTGEEITFTDENDRQIRTFNDRTIQFFETQEKISTVGGCRTKRELEDKIIEEADLTGIGYDFIVYFFKK